jgi:hypothetical protein
MIIPSGPKKERLKFVLTLIDECGISRTDRATKNTAMTNYALCGGEDANRSAIFNKTYAYLDDLQSLLYSPVSLRYNIGDSDNPSILETAKGRAGAAKLRGFARRSETDTLISDGVWWSLVKGKTMIKSAFKREFFHTSLVQPEAFGVRHENHGRLDEDMEAFCHTMILSFEQLTRMVWSRSDRKEILRKAQNYVVSPDGPREAQRQIITGALYPLQPASSGQSSSRGIVDWLQPPIPSLDPRVRAGMVPMHELWVWDDQREDWATFQVIGDEILLMGGLQTVNAFAYSTETKQSDPTLKGHHPFNEICVNPIDGYFWGRSEILNVAMLQEALSSRLEGINRLLRRQEDPSYKISGSAGVNQNLLARFRKGGSYYADSNPTAKIEAETPQITADLWTSLHEYERMFDEMGGLPPTARGHGEAGVRSHAHAETLVRMFSPRFKDRALLVERDVEGIGGLHLDIAKAHISKKLLAWVPKDAAGPQASAPNELIPPPAKGLVAVAFSWPELDEDATLTVDSHSSSPAFVQEAKALTFDLFKIGAMGPEDVVMRSDVSEPEAIIAGIERRAVARQEQAQQAEVVKLASHGGKK